MIGKIPHDFLILTSIELALKTFIGIQVKVSVDCSEVLNLPFYWGKIELDETIAILEQEPPRSYLFRKLESGSVTMACLDDSKLIIF